MEIVPYFIRQDNFINGKIRMLKSKTIDKAKLRAI